MRTFDGTGNMSDEEKEEGKSESLEERRKKMREKMKEMQEKGGPGGRSPQGSGLAAMMQQMAGGARGGGQQNRAMMETMKKLRADMQEIKDYLRKIVDTLENE